MPSALAQRSTPRSSNRRFRPSLRPLSPSSARDALRSPVAWRCSPRCSPPPSPASEDGRFDGTDRTGIRGMNLRASAGTAPDGTPPLGSPDVCTTAAPHCSRCRSPELVASSGWQARCPPRSPRRAQTRWASCRVSFTACSSKRWRAGQLAASARKDVCAASRRCSCSPSAESPETSIHSDDRAGLHLASRVCTPQEAAIFQHQQNHASLSQRAQPILEKKQPKLPNTLCAGTVMELLHRLSSPPPATQPLSHAMVFIVLVQAPVTVCTYYTTAKTHCINLTSLIPHMPATFPGQAWRGTHASALRCRISSDLEDLRVLHARVSARCYTLLPARSTATLLRHCEC